MNYSTVNEFTPSADANGNYAITAGSEYYPANFIWMYLVCPRRFYAAAISHPDGDTLMNH